MRSIKTKAHPETKRLFWFIFAATRGGMNRIRIMSHLRNTPTNTNQLTKIIGLDYKSIQHHIRTLEKNNIITKVGNNYGATYFPSVLFEEGESLFDEIIIKLNKVSVKNDSEKNWI